MADDRSSRILSDTNSYILDWLVAKPSKLGDRSGDEKENRINALMAILAKESGGGNVVPFKSRKK
ncbi:MAG: hypothetical protein BMS9Abin24_234 [Thermodesulfobacteriota bacterium]|nr:MAG: hypothetical protein BMS9Abin24_234 [Thermodesulfobacteriota bacterium]